MDTYIYDDILQLGYNLKASLTLIRRTCGSLKESGFRHHLIKGCLKHKVVLNMRFMDTIARIDREELLE